jgi:DNA-binding MarR family transcriptional regulator
VDPHENSVQRNLRSEHVAMTVFLYAILDAADRLHEARAFDGTPALALDSRSVLLRAIERCGGAPSFADLGRLLRITAPSAREQALAAERAGAVELFPSPDDRRVIQVALTPAGRRQLETRRLPPLDWLFTLLNGLDPGVMRSTERILRTISERLARYEREMRAARRGGKPGA